MYKPYFERLEDLRLRVVEMLIDSEGMTIHEILENVTEFKVPSTRHLVAVLARDPKKRFKCVNKIWRIVNT
jgi:hypothetical protein